MFFTVMGALGALAAAAAATTAVGYVAVTRFAAVERVLVAAMSRGLRRISKAGPDGKPTHTITRVERGAHHCRHFHRSAALIDALISRAAYP
jgi:hypothetical protein